MKESKEFEEMELMTRYYFHDRTNDDIVNN